jgi:putative ABC transport system permease protein
MLQELRHAVRLLLKSPGFTVMAVLTLGIGIGANVTVFSIVEAVLIRPLPVPNPAQLVRLYSEWEPAWPYSLASAPDFLDWRERNTVFQNLAACRVKDISLQGASGAQKITVAAVSPNYFQVVGVNPSLGRAFLSNEDQPGSSQVVVLSESLGRQLFGSPESAVGRTIQLDAEPYTIVGIAPGSSHFPDESVQLWMPVVFNRSQLGDRGNRWLEVYGRLKPEVSLSQARAQMSDLAANIEHQYPNDNTRVGIRIVTLQDDIVGNQRPGLLMLQGAVGCMLLIASFNLANLLLSRAVSRKRELAIRASLGASRWRLVRQSLVESLLLGAGGGLLGIILANWGIKLFTFLANNHLPRSSEVHLNGMALLFLLVLLLLVGTICGLLPALAVSGRNAAQNVLRENSRGSAGGIGQALVRNALVIAEIGCALVVLSCAGLLLRSFLKVEETDSGIQHAERILTASISLPPTRYPKDELVRSFYQELQERLTRLPGVKSAGATTILPLTKGDSDTSLEIVGRERFPAGHEPVAQFRVIGGDYFPAAGIPLIAGRLLDTEDGPDDSPTILINRSMALRFWKSPTDALGHKIENGAGWTGTIVGVVGDVRQFGLTAPTRDEFYFPISQSPHYGLGGVNLALGMVVVIRAVDSIDPITLASSLRQNIAEIDPTVPVSRVKIWSELIADSFGDRQLNLWFVGTFAVVALMLAAMGIYSVISYGVAQRTREIAVRTAVGAQRSDVFRLLLVDAAKLIGVGIGVGLLVALCLMQLMQGLLYGVGATDPQTFCGVIAILMGVGMLANYLPTRRAMKIDPVIALKQE